MKYEATIPVPACWRRLIKVKFPEDLAEGTFEKQYTGIYDPNPHYNEDRCVEHTFPDGMRFILSLSHGLGLYCWQDKTSTHVVETMEKQFLSEYHHYDYDVNYHVRINWVERRPHES